MGGVITLDRKYYGLTVAHPFFATPNGFEDVSSIPSASASDGEFAKSEHQIRWPVTVRQSAQHYTKRIPQ